MKYYLQNIIDLGGDLMIILLILFLPVLIILSAAK